MACLTTQATNERLDAVIASLTEMQQWALADAEHAAENDAGATAKDDRQRAKLIGKAITLLRQCDR